MTNEKTKSISGSTKSQSMNWHQYSMNRTESSFSWTNLTQSIKTFIILVGQHMETTFLCGIIL